MEKSEIVTRLSQLRQTLEQETGGLTEDQLYLLTDVCRSLELSDHETSLVVDQALSVITILPAELKLTPLGREFPNGAGNGGLVTSSVPLVEIRVASG